MPIAYCELDIFLPYCQSLKEKRMILRKTQDRLRSRFNFSVAEIAHQDLWQRSQIGAVTVGADRKLLEQLVDRFVKESEDILGEALVESRIEIID
jgi:uncharacterized protein YlxP (DUF503 family)